MFIFMQIKSILYEKFARRLVLKQGSFFSRTCPIHVHNTYSGFYTYAIFLDLDQEPPVFTRCPSDITIDDATTLEIRVNWQEPTATDNSGVLPSVSSISRSGDLFAVPGSYEVVYTAKDESGNEATCSFRITLKRKYTELDYTKHRANMYLLI